MDLVGGVGCNDRVLSLEGNDGVSFLPFFSQPKFGSFVAVALLGADGVLCEMMESCGIKKIRSKKAEHVDGGRGFFLDARR